MQTLRSPALWNHATVSSSKAYRLLGYGNPSMARPPRSRDKVWMEVVDTTKIEYDLAAVASEDLLSSTYVQLPVRLSQPSDIT